MCKNEESIGNIDRRRLENMQTKEERLLGFYKYGSNDIKILPLESSYCL